MLDCNTFKLLGLWSLVQQLVSSLLFTAGRRLSSGVCVLAGTQTWWCIRRWDRSRFQNSSRSRVGGEKNKTGTLSSAVVWQRPNCYRFSAGLRCPGRAGKSTRGCRRQVTRKRTASCGGVLGEHSEGTAELSDDTLRGTRRRSRHTCEHEEQRVTRSSTFPVAR